MSEKEKKSKHNDIEEEKAMITGSRGGQLMDATCTQEMNKEYS